MGTLIVLWKMWGCPLYVLFPQKMMRGGSPVKHTDTASETQ